MNKKDKFPCRVWINCPSTLQPYHKFHGLVGIAVLNEKDETVTIHFTEGDMHSMVVNPLYLENKNSQANCFKYSKTN